MFFSGLGLAGEVSTVLRRAMPFGADSGKPNPVGAAGMCNGSRNGRSRPARHPPGAGPFRTGVPHVCPAGPPARPAPPCARPLLRPISSALAPASPSSSRMGTIPAKTPSLALQAEPARQGPVAPDWKIEPAFSTGTAGESIAHIDAPPGTGFYGTGEVTGPLLRNGTHDHALEHRQLRLRKRDNGSRLYQSHPWVLGVRPDGTAFGVLFDTTWKAELACAATTASTSPAQGPALPRVRHRPRLAAGRPARAGGADRHHAAAAALGARLPPVPLLLFPGRARAGDRGRLPLAPHPVRRHLAGHRLHGRLPHLHLRPRRASPTRRRPTTTCTRTGSTPSG